MMNCELNYKPQKEKQIWRKRDQVLFEDVKWKKSGTLL